MISIIFSYLMASLFAVAAVIFVLLALGLPFGEFAMGGRYKVIPKPLRITCIACVLIQIFAIFIILQVGSIVPIVFTIKTLKTICLILAAFLTVNFIMNMFSGSKKEKYIAGPLSVIAAIYFWIMTFRL